MFSTTRVRSFRSPTMRRSTSSIRTRSSSSLARASSVVIVEQTPRSARDPQVPLPRPTCGSKCLRWSSVRLLEAVLELAHERFELNFERRIVCVLLDEPNDGAADHHRFHLPSQLGHVLRTRDAEADG